MKRTHQLVLLVCFLALLYVVPAAQTAVEIARGQAPQFLDVFGRFPTQESLRAYEKELEDQSVFARAARPWIQSARFFLFRDAGEKILVGRDNWLFYKPDVRYLVESPVPPLVERPGDPMGAIADFRDQLRARGIHLMVMPVPGKPSLYGNMLTWRVGGSPSMASPTLNLIERLREAGIETVDLFRLFGGSEGDSQQPHYLARDTHWSAAAAEIAAATVASRLLELGWAQQGAVDFAVRPVVVHRRGDIARMTQVPWIEASFPAEEVISHQVFESASGALYQDDPASRILVLGDSFLRMYQIYEPTAAGFIAHLARELRQPLASITSDGGASTLVRQELARRPQLLRGKQVVIWEFVERDIRFGIEGWKHLSLPPELQAATPLQTAMPPQAAMPALSRNP